MISKFKRFASLVLTLCLTLTMLPALFITATAEELPFTDVPESAWYYGDIKTAYESGLINGTSAAAYSPDKNLTYAEAIKLASCMHELYTTGSVTLLNGSPVWYQSYIDYAKANNIIAKDYAWTSSATRAGYMEIFASALPAEALSQINAVADGDIPDVAASHASAAAIYKLYRAGILQGVDAAHNCNPSANIKRSEVAAILTRMMDSGKRIRFDMSSGDPEPPEAGDPDMPAAVDAQTPTVRLASPQDAASDITVSIKSGDPFTAAVAASVTDGGTLSYQWQLHAGHGNWDFFVHGKSASIFWDKGLLTESIMIRCEVTNSKDGKTAVAYSPIITVTVSATAEAVPVVTLVSSASVNAEIQKDITLTVKATVSDGSVLHYDWQRKKSDGTFVSTTGSYTSMDTYESFRTPAFTVDFQAAGTYQFRCKVMKNASALEVYSPVITVTVTAPAAAPAAPQTPSVTLLTQAFLNVESYNPTTFKISADVTDGGTLTYQWQSINADIYNSDPSNTEWGHCVDSTSLGNSGARTASFTTQYYYTDIGKTYYLRCMVTNTKDGKKTVTYSPGISVTVKQGPPAPPVVAVTDTFISAERNTYFMLEVSATSKDGGTLTYEWQTFDKKWTKVEPNGTPTISEDI